MKSEYSHIESLLRTGEIDAAEARLNELKAANPEQEYLWILAGQVCQIKGDLPGMLAMAQQAVAVAPNSFFAGLFRVEASFLNGQYGSLAGWLTDLENGAQNDAAKLQQIAIFYVRLERHACAKRCYERALSLSKEKPVEILYNLAMAESALGALDRAETLLDQVILARPDDYSAYYNRSNLRTQTAERNHIAQLKGQLDRHTVQPEAAVQLGFALAKELEDLSDYSAAFRYLKQAADLRRNGLSYQVTEDIETMQEIRAAMQGDFFAGVTQQQTSVAEQPCPIFILGQPRSGTTLVDRIISSHSQVESLGEINDFVVAFMQQFGRVERKSQLIEQSVTLDFDKLGAAYLNAVRHRGNGQAYFIDKTPSNYLYIGLIAKALPQAKIIHLRRNPMDSCYAMYKTLFQMGYPYSYSLEDLGQYYVEYLKLMSHWRTQLPGRVFDVDYESLVREQEVVSRQLLAYCDLDWDDACLNFHTNQSPSSTASVAQVRDPIYLSSINKWQHFEAELEPLKQAFVRAGVTL